MSVWKTGLALATIAAGDLTNAFGDNEFVLVTPSSGIKMVTFFIKRVIDTETDLLMRTGYRLVAGGDIYWSSYASGGFVISPRIDTIANSFGNNVPVDVGVNQRIAEVVVQFRAVTPGGSPGSVEVQYAFDTSRGY